MKPFSLLVAMLLAAPVMASAQAVDPATEVSGYTRFLVYPHLQKGLESMQRGERDRALTELERAHSLAPESVPVTLHLAAAYRRFGEVGRAESLLREQIKRTPGDARLRAALTELGPTVKPVSSVARVDPCADAASAPCGKAPTLTAELVVRPHPMETVAPPAVPARRAHPQGTLTVRKQPSVHVGQPDITTEHRRGFSLALQTHRFDDAQREADTLLAHDGSGALLEDVTYKLVDAGATEQAARVLLRSYPFADRAPLERDTLLQRLILLIEQHPGLVTPDQLLPLRHPLDTPALRSRQGVLWASLQECGAIRAVLGDLSSAYGQDDWMRLGDCSAAEEPLLAQQAYARAHALQPGGRASRALGYQAFATGDFSTSLEAWRSVGAERLSGDELLGAVSTALAASQPEQAASWLNSYRDRGDTLNHRFWSLVAQSSAVSDPTAAISALEHAIALAPEADDYLRLAGLERDSERQVTFLERAAELNPENGNTQAGLAYAYVRAGRPASALRAFERAAALDPENMHLQIELGYAYWHAGRPADAQHALERAWRADPANAILAQQLVYVHQRLKQNNQARWYVEQVLTASASSSEGVEPKDAVAAADQRFGFQRLHEDLGRRVTLNLDGFSGTHVGTGISASQPGSGYRSYSQFEADFRLGSPPVRDGATLSAYARVLADGGDLTSALPSHNAMLGVGLSWKPWRSQVIYLAAENQNGLDDHSRRDVLLRASASFLNGGRYGDDWHPSRSGWFSRNLYLDAAQYLETKHSAFTVDYRTSYHRRVSTAQTLEPYGHLQLNGAESSRFERDVRAGVGLRWNIWHGATPYDAAPHKISLGVEFQQAFQTYLIDRNGLFLTFGSRW
jgi:adsorption protein A